MYRLDDASEWKVVAQKQEKHFSNYLKNNSSNRLFFYIYKKAFY